MRWPLAVALCASSLVACSQLRKGEGQQKMTGEMQAQANKAVVVRLFEEYFNRQQDEILDQLIAPQFVNPANGKTGVEGMSSGASFLRQTFGNDLRFTMEDVIADGDRVAVRWTLHGKHLGEFRGAVPTGRSVELPAIVIYRLVDHRIIESWLQTGALRPASPQQQAQQQPAPQPPAQAPPQR